MKSWLARTAFSLASILAVCGTPFDAGADWSSSAMAPPSKTRLLPTTLRAPRGSVAPLELRLEHDARLVDAIAAAKRSNATSFEKRLQIGVGRELSATANASALPWNRVVDGWVGHWEITSPGATGLRIAVRGHADPSAVELRFAGASDPATVYGPFTAHDLFSAEDISWSPVLDGQTAIVEVFLPEGITASQIDLSIATVSHLFASPRDSDEQLAAKAGASGFCEVDLICRSATDAALANVGRAVARMTFTAAGSTYLCTGTLLNPLDNSFIPYFFSANHCISTQAVATTLTTHWFYDSTSCGTHTVGPSYTQLPGGAAILYANALSDGLLVRLNATPPQGAVYSAWDSSSVTASAAVSAIHHPAGDLKKISLGTIGGFAAYMGGNGTQNHIVVDWNSIATGVTEGGSSGSGIFTQVGQPATDYRLRGGLHGGPSSCTASPSNLLDYYSRLDQIYPYIAQYLNPVVACGYTLVPSSASFGAEGGSGSFGVSTGSGCAWTAISGAGWITTTSSGNDSGTVTYFVAANTNAAARSGTITVGGQNFTIQQAAGTTRASTTTTLTSSANPSSAGQQVTFTAKVGASAGTPTGSVTFKDGITALCSAIALNTSGNAICAVSGLSLGIHTISAEYSGDSLFLASTSTVLYQTVQSSPAVTLALSPASIDFGGQSMNTTSPPHFITIRNTGTAPLSVTGIALSNPRFAQSSSCASIAPAQSCSVAVTFSPAASTGPLNSTVAVSGTLTISSNASGSPHTAALTGIAQRSLVSHYYRSVLRREPDSSGEAFWQGEAARMQSLGVSVNEAWYAMAMSFFGSAEYMAMNRSNAEFVRDLYTTFFNRPPDSDGLSYWADELAHGMPRDVALTSFMFSTEFANFTSTIFGNTATRPEINTAIDFYRGLLGRLPDSAGFTYWLGQFRAAQCQGSSVVYAQVEAISSAYAQSAEYAARSRSNGQYVGDLYNAFLRRGGDLGGVQYWIGQLDSGAAVREQLRRQFLASPEFNTRVNAIVAAGCYEDPNLTQTKLLLGGTWTYVYTIINTFSSSYSFSSVSTTPDSSGAYMAFGSDAYGGAVVGAYFPASRRWAVLDPGVIIDNYYTFTFVDDNHVSGCYYLINPPGSTNLSPCYSMAGIRSPFKMEITSSDALQKLDEVGPRQDGSQTPADVLQEYLVVKAAIQ